jgi:phosphatidylinositol kinase/protein kinase (PI-3  family)
MTEILPFNEASSSFQSRKWMLLYKNEDDDLQQELFAINFNKTCDALLKASGLNLSMLTFHCILVGAKQGFIGWVPGSVPFSDICKAANDIISLSQDVSSDSEIDPVLAIVW